MIPTATLRVSKTSSPSRIASSILDLFMPQFFSQLQALSHSRGSSRIAHRSSSASSGLSSNGGDMGSSSTQSRQRLADGQHMLRGSHGGVVCFVSFGPQAAVNTLKVGACIGPL